jgi:hypothetical protein
MNLMTLTRKWASWKKYFKKSKKIDFDTIRRGVYCQNCFDESRFTKECKLLMKFCRICKASGHNKDQCPSKVVSGSCPSRKIILVHVVQTKMLGAQEQKQLPIYNAPNNQNQYNDQ